MTARSASGGRGAHIDAPMCCQWFVISFSAVFAV